MYDFQEISGAFEKHLFAQLRFYVVNHRNGIVAAENILFAIFHFDEKAVAPAAIVTKIGSYHDVAEISPITEKSTAGAQP